MVYNGGEDSIQAAVSLDAGSDEHIHDTEVSFKTIHDAISKWKDNVQADFNAGSPEIRATAANAGDGSYAGSHFVSLSDIAQQPTTIGTGGISFLNESEIEGTRQPASEATNIVTEVAAPTQTLTETTPIQSTAVHVDWSTSASATNWADEDSYDTPAQSDPFALPQTNGKPTQIQEPDLQPVEDFKTIEKKSSNRDGRGRVSTCYTMIVHSHTDVYTRDVVQGVVEVIVKAEEEVAARAIGQDSTQTKDRQQPVRTSSSTDYDFISQPTSS